MIKQKWAVKINDRETTVEYLCSTISGKTTLTVNGDSFTVKGKPFGIGLVRREMIMLGEAQAILDIKKGGRATLICREAEISEL